MFSRIYLEITNCCNLSCAFCPGTRRARWMLPAEEFRLLAGKLRPWTDYLYLHVLGEPLLHPQLAEILASAGELGFRVCLVTNGTLLAQRLDMLLAAPALHKLSVSLHSFEANDALMPLETYLAAVWDGCARLAERGVLCALRLWNEGGLAEKNAEILRYLERRCGRRIADIPVDRRGNRTLRPNLFLEHAEKFDWPAPGAPLLRWYDENRRVLPWREEVSAYRTWVSEIMLQQTRVAAVLPYFERFMAAFPDVAALAAAEPDRLMKLWEGLGYYSRARNLQKAAKIVTEQYGGQFPRTYDGLCALPGIGDYTAGAILSIAFGQAVPAVDGNVLRVAARITGSGLDILDAKNRRTFRAWMAAAMSRERPGEYNQALMDLGATVCTPGGEPLCDACPARDFCRAHQTGRERQLPVRAPKKARRREEKTVFLLVRECCAALRRRPEEGLLAGLWEYPHVEGKLDEHQAAAQLAAWGLTPHHWVRTISARHIFTHIEWYMTGYLVEVTGEGAADWVWLPPAQQRERAVPSAFEKFTRALDALEEGE